MVLVFWRSEQNFKNFKMVLRLNRISALLDILWLNVSCCAKFHKNLSEEFRDIVEFQHCVLP